MICAIISASFSLMFWFMGLMFQLVLWILQALFVAVCEIVPIVVEAIFSFIGACFGATSGKKNKTIETKPMVKYVPAKETSKSLSKRERKAIEKNVRRQINKARDDMEYDMLMMMEVCAND